MQLPNIQFVQYLYTFNISSSKSREDPWGRGRSLLEEVAVAHLRAVGPVPGQAAAPRLPHLQLCLVVHPVKVLKTFVLLFC